MHFKITCKHQYISSLNILTCISLPRVWYLFIVLGVGIYTNKMHKSWVYHSLSFDKCIRLCDPNSCQDTGILLSPQEVPSCPFPVNLYPSPPPSNYSSDIFPILDISSAYSRPIYKLEHILESVQYVLFCVRLIWKILTSALKWIWGTLSTSSIRLLSISQVQRYLGVAGCRKSLGIWWLLVVYLYQAYIIFFLTS